MLQPHQPSPEQQFISSRIVWAGLTMSMLLYGLALFVTQKVTHVAWPSGETTPLGYLALAGNLIAVGVVFFYKNNVQPEKEFSKKFTPYVICWALAEAIVILGFAAVFTAQDGNGFHYVTNLLVGITANIFCFPKK